jgi:hypothetical protein
MLLQRGNFARQGFQVAERYFADIAVFECHAVAQMLVGTDGIHAHQVAHHVKTGDLFAAILMQYAAFHETRTDGVQRLQLGAGAVNVLAALHRPPAVDELVNRF